MRNISLRVITLSALLGILCTSPVLAATASPSDADKESYDEVYQEIFEDEDNSIVTQKDDVIETFASPYDNFTGWVHESDGNWYYYMNGEMLTNTYTPDGYYVGEDGAWEGTMQSGTTSSGDPSSYPGGWVEIDGKWYYYIDGEMLTNTYTPDGYYVGEDGAWEGTMQSGTTSSGDPSSYPGGWVHESDGNWYYYINGEMLTDSWTPDGYYVGPDGKWESEPGKSPNPSSNIEETSSSSNTSTSTSKKSSSGGGGGGGGGSSSKSIASASSTATGGPSAGYTTEGVTLLDGSWEALEDGHMKFVGTDGEDAKSQWILINDNYYFADPDGIMVTGWQIIDNNWYYFDPVTGIMLHDTITPDGYIVGSDGIWIQE